MASKKKTSMTLTESMLRQLNSGKRVKITRQSQQTAYRLRNEGYEIDVQRTPKGNYYTM